MAEPEEPDEPEEPIDLAQQDALDQEALTQGSDDPDLDPYPIDDDDGGYDIDEDGNAIIDELPVRACSEPGCVRTIRQDEEAFDDGALDWIRNRKPDNSLEYWCPDHGARKCKHGEHGRGGVQSYLFQKDLKVSLEDGRPSVVCLQCKQVWVCAPADLLMGDKLPKDVLVDMIHEGRYDEALTVFYELCSFSAQPMIPANLVQMAEQLLSIKRDPTFFAMGFSLGMTLAKEVMQLATSRPQDPAFQKQDDTPQSLPDNPTDVKGNP